MVFISTSPGSIAMSSGIHSLEGSQWSVGPIKAGLASWPLPFTYPGSTVIWLCWNSNRNSFLRLEKGDLWLTGLPPETQMSCPIGSCRKAPASLCIPGTFSWITIFLDTVGLKREGGVQFMLSGPIAQHSVLLWRQQASQLVISEACLGQRS